ncbi:unnamed protein product, partial [Heterobilharzia americana]
ELIFKASFSFNNITQQSVQSQPVKIQEMETRCNNVLVIGETLNDSHIVDHITMPFYEHLSLNVSMDQLLNHYNAIQIIFEVFIQTTSSSRVQCLTRIVFGSILNANNESAVLQWNNLITEVNQLEAYNSLSSTRKITYWHSINRF